MNRKDLTKSLLLVPFVLSGAMAIMFLSYMMVPLMIVLSIGGIVYAFLQAAKMDKDGELD